MTKTSQMTATQIDKALEAGIITATQANLMRTELKTLTKPPTNDIAQIGNEENLRFLRSFSDVFISIGLILLGLGAAGLVRLLGGGIWNWSAAGACFAFAYYFGRKKRAHLPTLILALAFLVFIQAGAGSVFNTNATIAAIIALLAMSGFYFFIRLPFCVALIAVAGLYLVFAILGQFAPGLLREATGPTLIVCGSLIFLVALFYDARDLHRKTRFSDNAFWLHFLAAPLIIHGLAVGAIQGKVERLFGMIPYIEITQTEAVVILIMVGIVSVIGLAINRRALIVSSLGYAGFALIFLMNSAGLNIPTVFVATLILLGLSIVLLGIAWHGMRNVLVKLLPKWRIFPPPYDPDFGT